MKLLTRSFVALILCGAAVGCGGPPRVIVEGKITKDGSTLPIGQKDTLIVVFHTMSEDGQEPRQARFPAAVKTDGTFRAAGRDGKGIPPGKYRVVVQHAAANTNEDKLQGAFGPNTSKIIREIPAAPEVQQMNFDLGKPTG